jgi:hypothetical protein
MTANLVPAQASPATIAISITLLRRFDSSLPQLFHLTKNNKMSFVASGLTGTAGEVRYLSVETRKEELNYGRNSEVTDFSILCKHFFKNN